MRYQVSINSADPTLPGLNLNVQVEADDALGALDKAKPELAKVIAAVVGQLKGQPAK